MESHSPGAPLSVPASPGHHHLTLPHSQRTRAAPFGAITEDPHVDGSRGAHMAPAGCGCVPQQRLPQTDRQALHGRLSMVPCWHHGDEHAHPE
eukprot:3931587-Rhodomonas_salina.1